jgi:hypothetical protein
MAYGSGTPTTTSSGAVASMVLGVIFIAADTLAAKLWDLEIVLGLGWLHLWVVGLGFLGLGVVWAVAIILGKP